jgi:hypothetical protein
MLDRRRLLDPMAQVEDVGAVGECVKDARTALFSAPPGNQRQRVELPWTACCGLSAQFGSTVVESNRIDPVSAA